MSNGKGHTRRPRAITRAEDADRWDATFGPSNCHETEQSPPPIASAPHQPHTLPKPHHPSPSARYERTPKVTREAQASTRTPSHP